MQKLILLLSIGLLFVEARPFSCRSEAVAPEPTSTTLVWNVAVKYGHITQASLQMAVDEARAHFKTSPNDTIIIQINAGRYAIGGTGGAGIALGNSLQTGPRGQLTIQGAGMDKTTLVFTDMASSEFMGSAVRNFTLRDLTCTRPRMTVSQGIVARVEPGQVWLDIQPGFPTPQRIVAPQGNPGKYLRRYSHNPNNPLLDMTVAQVDWTIATRVTANRWLMQLKYPRITPFLVGDLIGIKSMAAGNAVWFGQGGNRIQFVRVRWMRSTRVLVRGGPTNVLISGCRIDKDPPLQGQSPCLASPHGGPQLNQPNDALARNMFVENCYFDSAGDDLVAFFHVDGGHVTNSLLRNGFARGLLVTKYAQNICVDSKTKVVNCLIQGVVSTCP